jgi:ribose transport system substrate-binding protein
VKHRRSWMIGASALVLVGAASHASAKTPTVCFVTFSMQVPFFQSSVKGGKAEAAAQGATFVLQDPQADAQRQVTQVEDCISRHVDAIVIDAVEQTALTGAIQDASEQGIKIVAIDAPIPDPHVVANIGVANIEASKQFGNFVAGWILGKMGGKAKIGVMLASTEVQLARRDGLVEALKSVPGAEIVATGDGRNILERASSQAEDMIQAHPDLDVIYATGDPQLQGALAAGASKPNQHIAYFGWDDIPEPFVKPIEDGRIIGFTTQVPSQMGQLGVRYALDAVAGKTVPSKTLTPVEIVTQGNLSHYK